MRAYGPADSFDFANTTEPSTLYFEDSVRTAREHGSLAVNRDDPHVSDRTGQIVTGYNEGYGKDHWPVQASGYNGPWGVEIISAAQRALPLTAAATRSFDTTARLFAGTPLSD